MFENVYKKKFLMSVFKNLEVSYSYCFYFLNIVEVFAVYKIVDYFRFKIIFFVVYVK